MKVLLVTDSPTVSGAEHVWFGYLPALQPPSGGVHVYLGAHNERLRQALVVRATPHTITASFSPRMIETTLAPSALWSYGRAFLTVRRELCALIERERPDIIHSISFPACLYGALAARATGVPQVWHEHNIKRVHAVNSRLYRYVASSCAWIVGPSKAVTDNIARAGVDPKKLVPLYNGINLAKFAPDDERAARIRAELGIRGLAVGLTGQMLEHKGHLTLIDAAPAILAAAGDVQFVFAGALENPPYEARLRARIAELGLVDRFIFTGWRNDVPHVMRAMDLAVVATTTQEPAALSLMESMAMGRPLVATRTGGTPEIVIDDVTGLIYPPGDARALAAHVAALLLDPARRAAMGQAGRRRVEEHFTEERHVAGMLDLYERAVQQRRA